MPESFRFSVGPIGGPVSFSKISVNSNEICLSEALCLIRKLPVSEEQKDILSGLAKKVPNGYLNSFLANYRIHLKKV